MPSAGRKAHILVATSGDTGSAVGEAFKNVAGIDVTILILKQKSATGKKNSSYNWRQRASACVQGKFDDVRI